MAKSPLRALEFNFLELPDPTDIAFTAVVCLRSTLLSMFRGLSGGVRLSNYRCVWEGEAWEV